MLEMISRGVKLELAPQIDVSVTVISLNVRMFVDAKNALMSLKEKKNAFTVNCSDDESGAESDNLKLTVGLSRNMDAVSG